MFAYKYISSASASILLLLSFGQSTREKIDHARHPLEDKSKITDNKHDGFEVKRPWEKKWTA